MFIDTDGLVVRSVKIALTSGSRKIYKIDILGVLINLVSLALVNDSIGPIGLSKIRSDLSCIHL